MLCQSWRVLKSIGEVVKYTPPPSIISSRKFSIKSRTTDAAAAAAASRMMLSSSSAEADLIRKAAVTLPDINDPSFGSHFDRFGEHRIVLLGDCTHGTSEFYQARAEITKHLITNHGFNIIAIEADYPDAEVIDRYIRQRPGSKAEVTTPSKMPFERFPTWMWRNKETQDLVHWLYAYNAQIPIEKRAGFYGLDLYSLAESSQAVIEYLEIADPEMAKRARHRYSCLDRWIHDPSDYGLAALDKEFQTCEAVVLRMLKDLLLKRLTFLELAGNGEEYHSAEQNAHIMADAEAYFRVMCFKNAQSWNMRDRHMFETLQRLLRDKTKPTKAIVWAHNSHVGDARATFMGWQQDEISLGQLCRQAFGEKLAVIGCGTHTGTVAAAHDWGYDVEIMNVVPSRHDSYEFLCHETGIPSFLLDLRNGVCNDETRRMLMRKRQERYIGVIYRPRSEKRSHYVEAVLPNQFDAYVWFDKTKAVLPLDTKQPDT